ncbi:hypothetical protein [Bosea massiliensis]|uniref:Uncharacterized protein n=1 Tax=Bosea massiliensis TaxID=151419 RepID=A0ABW0P0J1_9HYPH
MKTLRNCLIAAACAVSAPAFAQSLSQQQQNATNHFAQVMVIANNCPDYKANELMIGFMIQHFKIDFDEAKTKALLRTRYAEHEKGFKLAGGKVGCLLGWSLYGPGGQNVPGLLAEK